MIANAMTTRVHDSSAIALERFIARRLRDGASVAL
jgi:hypothetical protein